MSRTRLLAGLVAGAGGVALANRRLRRRVDEPEPPIGRPQATYRWRGFDVAYTEAGHPADPDVVCLHGLRPSATSREFRPVVEDLATDHHVLAPDLPGFGGSDRPSLLYSAALYGTFLAEFCRDVADRPTVVAASLSGGYLAAAAPAVDVEAAVLACPTTTTAARRRPWLRTLLRAPVVGEGCFDLLVSRPAVEYALRERAVADPAAVAAEWVDHEWRSAHQPGARFAPASLLSGFLDPDVAPGPALRSLDVPVTLAWGRAATGPSVAAGRALAEAADARLVVFEATGLLPHVECPAAFAREVRRARSAASVDAHRA